MILPVKFKISIIRFSIAVLLFPVFSLTHQETRAQVTVEVEDQTEMFFTNPDLFKLPEGALELEALYTLNPERLMSMRKLTLGRDGRFYIIDAVNGEVITFDPDERSSQNLKMDKRARRSLPKPNNISGFTDEIIIQDEDSDNFVRLDLEGRYIDKFNIPDIHEFVYGQSGNIFTAPLIADKKSPLVAVYSLTGKKKLTFGNPVFFLHNIDFLNDRTLAVDESGQVWVAFKYLPIVRKYSSHGKFLAEYTLDSHPVMAAKKEFNLKKIGRGITRISQRAGFMEIIADIEIFKNRVYLLCHTPRIELIRLDESGEPDEYYWIEYSKLYQALDFLILEKNNTIRFPVLLSAPPEYKMDILSPLRPEEQTPAKQSMRKYDKTIAINPDHYLAYHSRGVEHYRHGDWPKAVDDFTKALERNPGHAPAFFYRGLARKKLGKLRDAVNDFTRAVAADPARYDALLNRGIILHQQGKHTDAIRDYTAALQLKPALLPALLNRGTAYLQTEEFFSAVEDFNKAVQLDPDSPSAYFNRGNSYTGLEDFQKALTDYEEAIALRPDYAAAYFNAGVALINLTKYEKAIQYFEKAARLDSELRNQAREKIKLCRSRIKRPS
jgi:tetratricopeptide (TPR) repeat protein